jgi:hypothetical protein
MVMLVIQTQVYENYGAHDWDGEGECPSYWKAKGGHDYVIKNFTNFANVTATVMALRSKIEQNNEYFREEILDWEIVGDDHLTWIEQAQLDYEGKITITPIEITL